MIGLVLLFIALSVLLLIMLSPLEALAWWAGWNKSDNPDQSTESWLSAIQNPNYESPGGVKQYVIFMTGIGGFSRDAFLPEERRFMDSLMTEMPEIRLVDDVYPYSSVEKGLTEGRLFSRFWNIAVEGKAHKSVVGFSINLRNMLQVFVAADSRYGPIYGWGLANILLRALVRHRYPFGSGMPVTLIGYSGGGEMSAQSVQLLHQILEAPIRVISLGGVISNEPGLVDVDHLYHIYGDKDKIQRLGVILFPGRWPIATRSVWNKACAAGKITMVPMGPFGHNGPGGYLDHTSLTEDGRSYFDVTVATIVRLLRENPHVV